MPRVHTAAVSKDTSLRLWPPVAAAIVLVVLRYVVPNVTPEIGGIDTGAVGLFGSIACFIFVLAWWLLFSRTFWTERLAGVAAMIVAAAAMWPFMHPSIQNGFMGRMYFVYALPLTLTLAFAAWAVVSRRLSQQVRRVALLGALVAGCAVWTLVRTDGILGVRSLLHWRWTPTAEERLLAAETNVPPAPIAPATAPAATPPAAASSNASNVSSTGATALPTPPATGVPGTAAAVAHPPREVIARAEPGAKEIAPARTTTADERAPAAEWPGFRGPQRDGIIRGVRIATDWTLAPPTEMWRRRIGPGWSSFSVMGDLVYTQEQRGDDELVSCYRLSTGETVWQHRDRVRFWESNGGPGPRATPTVHHGRVYTMGATGVLNALDATTGAVLWSRDVAADTGKTIPDWGVASSPIVFGDLVITALAGQLAAYALTTGDVRWLGQPGGGGYSSPHPVSIEGIGQVLLMRGARTISVNPVDGTLLWEHTTGVPATSIVQPAVVGEHDLLLASSNAMGGNGIRRVSVARGDAGWSVQEKWESRGLKPYFNDFVVHEGHAYGFDGNILSAIDLVDGTRKWKGGRYGSGQMVLLAEQDLLLVMSEEGELALVSATPGGFQEVSRFRVFEAKTWNHPVLVGQILLVRNGEEMAAFRMPVDTTR